MNTQQPYGYGQAPPPGNQGYFEGHPASGPPGAPPGQAPYNNYNQGAPPPGPGQHQYPPQGQPHGHPGQGGQYGQYPPQQYGQQQPLQQYGQQQPPPQQYGQPPLNQQYGQPVPPHQPYGQPQHQPPPQHGQYPPQQHQPYGQPPPGQHPPPHAGYGQQAQQYPPPQGYGGQQAYPPQQYPPGPPQQGYGYGAPPGTPAPASPGYDQAQRQWVQHVDTTSDIDVVRKAMKGMGCDEKALIRVFTDPKYANPWAMTQLKEDFNRKFVRHLEQDIESETRGDLETALLALIRGPLENDARVLEKALIRAGTDEDALLAVLVGRSNADIRAISAEYRRVHGRELLVDIKDDVKEDMYRLYSMVLAGTRAEDNVPVLEHEIDQKVTELQRATEGTIGVNAVAVAHIFTSCNNAQIHALSAAYQRKYHRALRDVIEDEFRGDMEKILLTMLELATDRARCDAGWLREPMFRTPRKDRLLIHRVLMLYWDPSRLQAAKVAYKQRFGSTLRGDLKMQISNDYYESLMLRLIGEK